jgi:hypothetical protein
MMSDKTYKQVPYHAEPILPCNFCGSPANMWQYTDALDVVTFTVMCSLDEEQSPTGDDCPLFTPPNEFYAATKRQAAKYWNEWAKFGNARRPNQSER